MAGGNAGQTCTKTISVEITQPAAVTLTATGTNVSCNGAADGTITASSTNGTITVDGVAYDATKKYAPGTYSVVATMAGGNAGQTCTKTISVEITQPAAVTTSSAVKASYNGSDLSCSTSADGKITVTASGGTGTFHYSKNNGENYQGSNVFSGLAAGTYQIKVKDANGCETAATSVTITAPSAVTISSAVKKSYNGSDLSCATSTDGEITVTASGGTGTLQYSKNNGTNYQGSNVFSGLAAGTYQIKVKDANGCETAATSVTITAPSAVGGSITSQTNVQCNVANSGSVTITGTGGTGGFEYKLGTGTYQTSGTFSGLVANSYVVTIKDANGCTTNVNVSITAYPTTTVLLVTPASQQYSDKAKFSRSNYANRGQE